MSFGESTEGYKTNAASKALEKITTGDTSAGGTLGPERFEQFFNDVAQQSTVLGQSRSVPVSASEGDIPRLSVASRVLRPVGEGESAQEATMDQPSVHYQTQKMAVAHSLTWESVNETIGNIEDALMSHFARQFSADLEILSSIGDESVSDTFESAQDGWYTLATAAGSPIYYHDDAGDGTGVAQPVDKSLFSGMRRAMPQRYKERQNLVLLGSKRQKEAFQENLTERGTAAADAALLQGDEPTPYGLDWLTPLSWPDDRFMLTSMSNLAYIIQDDMRVKSTTQAKENVMNDIQVFVNMIGKVDLQILESAGIVRAEGVAAPSA